MCRLGLFNKEFMENRGKDFMLDFLNQLEKSMGGHGNGILFIDGSEITLDYKALTLKNETIVDMLFNNKVGLPDWFLYHTRVASKGSIKDENCHPYVNDDKSFALMMNGTVSDFGAFGKHMGDITDTEAIFKMLDTFNVDLEVLTELSPRFIGFKNGKVFATNPSGYNGLHYTEEGGICIASESPLTELWNDLKHNFVWYEGDKLIEQPVVQKYSYSSKNYKNYATGWWDYLEEDNNLVSMQPKKDVVTTTSTCTECVPYDDMSYTKQELKEIIDIILEENVGKSMWKVQSVIDELVGVCPIVDNKYTDIIVMENHQIILQDEDGNVFEL